MISNDELFGFKLQWLPITLVLPQFSVDVYFIHAIQPRVKYLRQSGVPIFLVLCYSSAFLGIYLRYQAKSYYFFLK